MKKFEVTILKTLSTKANHVTGRNNIVPLRIERGTKVIVFADSKFEATENAKKRLGWTNNLQFFPCEEGVNFTIEEIKTSENWLDLNIETSNKIKAKEIVKGYFTAAKKSTRMDRFIIQLERNIPNVTVGRGGSHIWISDSASLARLAWIQI